MPTAALDLCSADRERFERAVGEEDASGCWNWMKCCCSRGYGQFCCRVDGQWKIVVAHRVAWTIANGPVPHGLLVLHRCDNKRCVRPEHLFLGTQADNMRDMIEKGRAAQGERQANAKLTTEMVLEIRKMLAKKVPQSQIGQRFGVEQCCISRISTGQRWGWLSEAKGGRA